MGLLYRVGSFRPIVLWDSGNFAGRHERSRFMKQSSLKNCIVTLERVRDAYSSRLDTSVLVELDDVIAQFKRLSESGQDEVKLGKLSYQALQIISQIVSVVSNIASLMK